VCVDKLKITPDLDGGSVHLRVAANSLADNIQVEAVATADGKEAGRITGLANTELVLPLTAPRLWTPEHPFLYDLHVTLKERGQVLDAVLT
jgi:beta-galactosidase/beta-glucuronidase